MACSVWWSGGLVIRALILCIVLVPLVAADSVVLDFEGFPDNAVLTTQYPGVTFSNAIILTAGISLNEFEFPPHSGRNVASDNGGPMSIAFASPIQSFSGYFTYLEPLTLTAFGDEGSQVAITHSLFSNNLACLAGPPCSGDSGSSPNELLQVSFPGGISRVNIAGDPSGGSFVIDDTNLAVTTVATPEPNTLILLMIAAAIGALSRKRQQSNRGRSPYVALSIVLGLCLAGMLGAAPTMGAIAATPTIVATNTSTTITVSVPITDGSVIPGSVNLLRVDAAGSTVNVIGALKDDGTAGDLVAGDGIYTGQTIINEASAGAVMLQVSAAFRDVLQRVKSAPIQITVQAGPVNSYVLFVNANDSLLLQGTAPTGEVVQYFGTKNATGLATSVTGFSVRDASNNVTRYTLDSSGRPTQILAANNALFLLHWNSDGTVNVTGVAPDGSIQTTVTIPVTSAKAVAHGTLTMTKSVLRQAQQKTSQLSSTAQPQSYLQIDLSKCGLGVSGASVWITVSHPQTGALNDVIQGIDEGNGTYGVPMPVPDPQAGQDVAEKCGTALGAIGNACDGLQANPLLPVAVCGTLAASSLPVAPEVLTACDGAFALLKVYCDTLGSGPGEALDQFVCPRIGALVDRSTERSVDLSLTVNGQPSGSRLGVPLSPPFAPFSVSLMCNPVRLNVIKSGGGTGTVLASRSVINCGGVCSDSFLPPSLVQMTAIPDASSKFTSWGGNALAHLHRLRFQSLLILRQQYRAQQSLTSRAHNP